MFLALTGVLLVWDLKRPDRFYYLLTKGNPGSWLVRGAWILGGVRRRARRVVPGRGRRSGRPGGGDGLDRAFRSALAVAGYTAFLFGQAEARDLWQSPTLLWHMIAGAFAAGGGAGARRCALVFDVGDTAETSLRLDDGRRGGRPRADRPGRTDSRHPTRNIAEAVHHMTRGTYAREWWLGGQVLGVVVPIVLGVVVLAGAAAVGRGARRARRHGRDLVRRRRLREGRPERPAVMRGVAVS